MGSNRLKPALGVTILMVLVTLNLKKYWVDESQTAPTRNYQEVSEIVVPPTLTDSSEERSSRDIFTRIEVGEDSQVELENEDVQNHAKQPKEAVAETVTEISSYEDVSLLGVSVRSGASMALIRYEGRSYYVAVGDVVGGRYFIESIDESGVYASTR